MADFDRSLSLRQLEHVPSDERSYGSHLVDECMRLHDVPLAEFSLEDLRVMIGQQMGLRYLIPLAIERLCADPLVEAQLYEGDLLATVLLADSGFWLASPESRSKATELAERAFGSLERVDEAERERTAEALKRSFDVFSRAEYFDQHGRS